MFKIKIEEKFNIQSESINKWFVEYDAEKDRPIFTDDESKAGLFVIDNTQKNDLWGNIMALYDRFGYKGTPVHVKK
jgi:hypothetical protein